MAAEGNIARIAAACRQLHAGGRFAGDFDMFDIQRRYRSVVASRGMRIPDGYDELAGQFEAMRAALAVRPVPTVPCNNDLLAGNFIDDGDRIWLIDYEYSGNNDPCFELGNIGSECGLSTDALADAGDGLLRPGLAQPDRQGPAARAGRQVRLDALGRHPARRQPDRLRLLVVGHGAVRGAVAEFAAPGFAALLAGRGGR